MPTPGDQKRLANGGGVDHISNLPDVILCHILSLIPTKFAVATSTLSKRWKYLWTKVAALDFSEHTPSHPYKSLSLKQKISFHCFVDRALLHNDASYLQHLCLDLSSGFDDFYVKSWLSAIARREIGMIIITLYPLRQDCIPLPSGFFSREKLVVLKLSGQLSINVPMSFHLPNLEIIHLTGLHLPDDEFLKRLSLGCRVLRELSIIYCFGMISTLHIESLSLETLDINTTNSRSGFPLACIIRAPNLQYLCLKGALTPHDFSNLSLLVEADLDIKWNDAKHVRELLQKISGVKTARLEISKFFGYESKPPIFLNLTHFKLRADGNMAKLLNCAPNLKSLIIEYAPSEEYPSVTEVWPESLSSLETVELQIFDDAQEHMALVAHFLKVASALKEMKIIMRYVNKNHLIDAYLELLALPRSSPSCQVKVVS